MFTDPADKSREAMPTLSPLACGGGEEEEFITQKDKRQERVYERDGIYNKADWEQSS